MHFQLNEEHLMIQKAARDFAINECLPGVIERDEQQKFARDQIYEAGGAGIYGDDGGYQIWRRRNGYHLLCAGNGGDQ